MLNAFAGGDAIEILVALRDMTEAGFKKVEHNLSSFESKANSTNLSGFSKATKSAEKDAENLAGKETKGGGGIGGAAAGLLSFAAGPVTVALAGMAAAAGGAIALTSEYDKVEPSIKALNTALADHGESLQALEPQINALIDSSAQYGYTAEDVRAGVTQLTEAGLNFQQVQAALPHVMDLARAKNIDLASATTSYTSAVFGNARALKQYGIILPPVTASSADLGKAQDKLKKAHENATKAEEQLTLVEHKLKGKHTLTAAEAIKLHDAEQKVKDANDKVKAAQAALTLAQQGGVDKGARLALVNQGLTKAIGDQRSSTTEMQVAQAKLSDAWEKLAMTVGPPLQAAFAGLITIGSNLILSVLDIAGKVGGFLTPVFQFLMTRVIQPAAAFIQQRLGPAFAFVSSTVGDLVAAVGQKLGPVFAWIGKNILPPIADFITNDVAPAFGRLIDIFGRIVGFILSNLKPAFEGISDVIGKVLDLLGKVVGAAKTAVDAIAKSPIGAIAGGVGNIAGGIAGGIGGLIPKFAAGGVVDRPTLALIGEGGEREYVIPESKMGGGGVVIHININSAFPPTPSMAADLADALERELGRRVLRPSGTGAF